MFQLLETASNKNMEVLRNDCVSINLKKENALLEVKWHRQISYTERQETFLWAYDFSKRNSVKNWLVDDKALFLITPEEKDWVANTWTRLVSDSKIEKIAVVTSDHLPNLMANTEFTLVSQEKYKQHGRTEHEVFIDHQLAYQWLTEGY